MGKNVNINQKLENLKENDLYVDDEYNIFY